MCFYLIKMNTNKQQWEKYQLKQKALKYYQENKIPEKMETVLNLMFHENPVDVNSYISNYFRAFAQSISIHKLIAYTAWDSKGQPTLGIDVRCIVNNEDKLVNSTIYAGSESQVWDITNTKQLLDEKQEKLKSVKTAVAYINGKFGKTFNGREILNSQSETDACIKSFFDALETTKDEKQEESETESMPAEVEAEHGSLSKRNTRKKSAKGGKSKVDVTLPLNDPPYEWVLGSPAGSALSQAVCATEAKIRDVLLFEHISSLASKNNQALASYRMPLLMVTMLHCGKLSAGKVNAFNEVMLIPSCHFSIKECVSHLLCIQEHMISIFLETNPKLAHCINNVSETGSMSAPFDKAEQVLDLIIKAIEAADFIPGTDFCIAINAASHQLVDFEKSRYEFVNGATSKNFEDTTEFWVDLLKTYPSIVALIDPLRKKEGKLWLHLCELISNHCLIIGDSNDLWPEKSASAWMEMKAPCHEINSSVQNESTFHQDEQVTDQVDTYLTSGHILRMQHQTTVSDFIKSVADANEAGTYAIPSVCQGEGGNTFIADLAVGLQSRFLKTGGLSRGERIQLLNRLIYIEEYLMITGKLEKNTVQWTFPKLEAKQLINQSELLE